MVKITSLDSSKAANESPTEYINRMCSIKDTLGLTWKQVSDEVNEELGLSYSDSWYRKNYKDGVFSSLPTGELTVSAERNNDNFDILEKEAELEERAYRLQLKKVEVSDLVVQNNAYLRRLSREETIKDIANNFAETMNRDKILRLPCPNEMILEQNDSEGILLLSDWHYGMVCDNHWNKFDPDVCKDRVNQLLNKVCTIVVKNKLDRVHVLDLADLIAGRIHTQIRIESRFDVITQTMQVAEILAEFLNNLSHYCNVSFYSCLDNHSRLEPNKKESMDLESLARLIPWYLTERLSDNRSIEIHENEFGADMITCTVAGHNIIGIHGDNDKPSTNLENLSLMTHQHYSMLCTAHLHHMQLEERHQSMVVSNGSLMGVDRYAEKLRLTSDPSQTFIIATPDNVCEAIYRIVLK